MLPISWWIHSCRQLFWLQRCDAHVQTYMSYLGFTLLKSLEGSSIVMVFYSPGSTLFTLVTLWVFAPKKPVWAYSPWLWFFPQHTGSGVRSGVLSLITCPLVTTNCNNSTTKPFNRLFFHWGSDKNIYKTHRPRKPQRFWQGIHQKNVWLLRQWV